MAAEILHRDLPFCGSGGLGPLPAGGFGGFRPPKIAQWNGEVTPKKRQSPFEMAIWVAVGGRGTLVGAIFGAGLVNVAKSWFTVAAPDYWLYFLGVLFIVVTLFLPKGFLGIFKRFSATNKIKGSA